MATATVKAARRKAVLGAVIVGGVVVLTAPSMVPAQAVEEHPAPLQFGTPVTSFSTSALANSPTDPTPFGVILAGISVVDAHTHGNAVLSAKPAGISTGLGGQVAQSSGFRDILAKYVGQPMSYKLISQIEADITTFYRDNGRSLVNVTVPPQEITSGVLQINVNTFVLETTAVEGSTQTGFLTSQIRLQPGQEVDTDTLLDDVNWLNQNPFRHVSVVFQPGATPDSTKLTLQVKNGRPWSAYAGFSNSGTDDTGRFRLFGGFQASALPWQDHQLSYQFTGAPESLGRFDLWNTGSEKGYLSHSLTYFIPLTLKNGFRTKVTFGASHISSYSTPSSVFTAGTETNVGNIELSFPLPKTAGKFSLVPEVYVQAEFDDYDRTQFFLGIPIDEEKTQLLHGVIGFRAGVTGEIAGKKTRGNVEVGLVFGQQNTEGDPEVTYHLVKYSASQEMFFDKDRSMKVRVSGQYSGDDLHSLEQMALGGDGTVRGYPVNSVSGRTAIAASIQYNFAPISFKISDKDGQFRPHVFVDAGFSEPVQLLPPPEKGSYLTGIGIGGEFGIGEDLVGTIDIARPMQDAGTTQAGHINIGFQMTARF